MYYVSILKLCPGTRCVRASPARHRDGKSGAHIDTNERRRALADWSGGACSAQCHVVARRGTDDRQAESNSVVKREEDWHVQWRVGVALGLILWFPDALLDDCAKGPNREVEQPSRVPLNGGERASTGHLRVAKQESGGPLCAVETMEGA